MPETTTAPVGEIAVRMPMLPQRQPILPPIERRSRTYEQALKENDVQLAVGYLRQRAKTLEKPTDEITVVRQGEKLARLCKQLPTEIASDFLQQPHVIRQLEDYLDLDPDKIALALNVNRKVQAMSQVKRYEPQLIPAVSLGCYSVLEAIREVSSRSYDWASMIRIDMKQKLRELEAAKSKDWATVSRYRHAARYLNAVIEKTGDRHIVGGMLENALIDVVGDDIHGKLSNQLNVGRELEQPQGFEVEVLTRYEPEELESARRHISHYVEATDLPRGIPASKHQRKDWSIMPLLGIKEDVEERKYQLFEASPLPTESTAPQSTIMFEMMGMGFIDERWLSNEKENYSMHISSVFPKGIVTEDSKREYRNFARVLAAGFSSNQRIKLGGYMAGGQEIADKTKSGNLKDIYSPDPRRSHYEMGTDMALIEIRNLDVTRRNHISALLNKQYLDYAFKCSWEQRVSPKRQMSGLEKKGAEVWRKFVRGQTALFSRYGLTETRLRQKYGDEWNELMWREIAHLRETNPRFQEESAGLVRQCSAELRRYKKSTEMERDQSRNRRLLVEPLGSQGKRLIYIDEYERTRRGLKTGDAVKVKFGDKEVDVVVAPVYLRGDGKMEGSESIWRTTQSVLSGLGIADGVTIRPEVNARRKEIVFKSAESEDQALIKVREPRPLRVESQSDTDNRIYMNEDDRVRMGLNPGDQITLRFGKFEKKVTIWRAFKQAGGDVDKDSWRLSRNLVSEIGLPADMPLRCTLDTDRRELNFGPTVAVLNKITRDASGKLIAKGWDDFSKQVAKQAKGMGVFVCFIDSDEQSFDMMKKGRVKAYVRNEKGELQQVTIPIPDQLIDKNIYWKRWDRKRELDHAAQRELIPGDWRDITSDKLKFAQILHSSDVIADYHPDTANLNPDSLDHFLNQYGKVVIKPRYGMRSTGIIMMEKTAYGTYKYKYAFETDQPREDDPSHHKWQSVSGEAVSVQEFLDKTKAFRSDKSYLVQERIPLAKHVVQQDGRSAERTIEVRVIVQRGIDGKARVTGMATRLPDPELTGREYVVDPREVLKSAFSARQAEQIEDSIRTIALLGNETIERAAKKPTAEITFDVGVTESGVPQIIEANSKAETLGMYYEEGNQDGVYNSSHRLLEFATYMANMD